MTLNVNLEDVPFAILEAVRGRIMSNRRRLKDNQEQQQQRPALQPKPQFRKFGADGRTWKRPQPAAVASGGGGWLLVPSADYDSAIGGFRTLTRGLPSGPFVTASQDGWIRQSDSSGAHLIKSPFVADPGTTGEYVSGPFTLSTSALNSFTFECLIGGTGVPPTLNTAEIVLLGVWAWEYDLEQTFDYQYTSNVVNVYTNEVYYSRIIGYVPGPNGGYIIDTSPDGTYRPPPPSEWWDSYTREIPFNNTTGGGIESFRVLREEQTIAIPPGAVARPSVEASSSCNVYISLQGESGTVFSGNFIVSAQAVNPGGVDFDIDLGEELPTEGSTFQISCSAHQEAFQLEEQQDYAAYYSFRHFAIVQNQQLLSFYISGSRVGEFEIPALTSVPNEPLELTISLSYSGPTDGFIISEEGAQGDGGELIDFVADRGFITAEAEMKMKIKGIRFTPGRALYRGPSFTPPTSIKRLA